VNYTLDVTDAQYEALCLMAFEGFRIARYPAVEEILVEDLLRLRGTTVLSEAEEKTPPWYQ
jgi:hypothetical protein